jgi:hypothetical protein
LRGYAQADPRHGGHQQSLLRLRRHWIESPF